MQVVLGSDVRLPLSRSKGRDRHRSEDVGSWLSRQRPVFTGDARAGREVGIAQIGGAGQTSQ